MIYIGIDPGLTGAVAVLRDGYPPAVFDMPTEPYGRTTGRRALDTDALVKLFDTHGLSDLPRYAAVAYLERVGAMPGQGVSSMFNLGMSYWGVRGICAALNLPVTLVTPQVWKAYLGLSADKAESLELARKLYPMVDLSLKKHSGRAEALLIARYGQSVNRRAV